MARIHNDVKWIHRAITHFAFFSFIFFLVVGIYVIPIFYTDYFKTLPPVTVIGAHVGSEGVFVFMLLVLIIDQILALINERVSIAIANCDEAELRKNYNMDPYIIRMLLKVLNTGLWWLRHVNVIIYCNSQLSFGLAIAVTDVIVTAILTLKAMEKRDVFKCDYWKNYIWHIVVMQLMMVPMYPLTLFAAGADNVGYFTPGPPLELFGNVVKSNASYTLLVFIVFFDQLLDTFTRDNVDAWIFYSLENRTKGGFQSKGVEGEEDNPKTSIEYQQFFAFGIYAGHAFNDWIRKVFIIRFVFNQYFMVLVYIVADVVGGIINVHRRYQEHKKIPKADDVPFIEMFRPGSNSLLLFLAMLQFAFTMIIVFVLSFSDWGSSSYFTWQDPLYFGKTLGTDTRSHTLIALAVILRMSQTFYEKVIVPDFYHYTYSDAKRYIEEGDDGTDVRLEVISTTVITRFVYWITFLFSLNLITSSSIKYAAIFASVDVPLSIIIILLYIRRKTRMMRNYDFTRSLNDYSRYTAIQIKINKTEKNSNTRYLKKK